MVLSRPNMIHPVNKTPIYVRERLSKNDVQLKINAEKEYNFVTTKYNNQVKVFLKTPETRLSPK